MLKKRTRFTIIVIVIALVAVSAIQAQNASYPDLPTTYEETIKLFPVALQSGFYGMYVALSTISTEDALVTMQAYYLCNWIKQNYIITGRGSEMGADGKTTFIEFYTRQRNALIAGIGNLMPAMVYYGNPGGTNWDVWMQRLMEWL